MASTSSLIYKRPVRRSKAHALGLVVGLALLGSARRAAADSRVYPARREAPELGYRVSLESRINHAERNDFSRLVFMFNQPVDRIVVRELSTTLDFRLTLFEGLSLDAKLPFSWRQADVRFQPVVVSLDEVLPPAWRDLDRVGLADSEVGLEYGLLDEPLDLHLHAGTVIPGSDNPGSSTVATQLPLSTGQTEVFAELSALLESGRWALGGGYRLGYRPRAAVAYLVRQVGTQSYASGALGDHFMHHLTAGLSMRLDRRFSFRLGSEWSIAENPGVVDHGVEYLVMPEKLRHELGVEGRFTLRIDEHNAFEAFYEHLFLRSWDKDPFFPIVIPEHGFGIAWHGWST
jgi:hypothetical protein